MPEKAPNEEKGKMKKIILTLMATLLLAGCLTEDYNLRAIKEDRNLSSTDSTTIGVSFGDTTWTATNAKQWASAGVIITSVDNVLQNNYQWLKVAVAQGFKGAIILEWDASTFNGNWFSSEDNTWNKELYNALTKYVTADWAVANTTGNVIVKIDPPSIYFYLDPGKSNIWGPAVGNVMRSQAALLLENINGTTENQSIYYKINYSNQYWFPNEVDQATMVNLDADPLNKGYNIGSYTSSDFDDFNIEWDNVIYTLRPYADLVVNGDRLDTTLYRLTDRSIKGVFFDNVTSANYQDVISKIANYRSAYIPVNEQDSILLIAGVKNDVYHETSSSVYATMINSFIQAGVYFTPGANASYFDYPNYQPGDWWIRTDDDSNWQSNPNNPTYTDYTTHPRKLYGLALSSIETQHAMSFPLGGHTWSSAIGHNNQYWVLGGDVSGMYTSTNGGASFSNHNRGIANDIDNSPYYGRDVIAVSNGSFEGFIVANSRGIYSLATPFTNSDPWVAMTDPEDNLHYTTYVVKNWGEAWMASIPFTGLDWDGNNLLCAVAGAHRFNSTTAQLETYPWNVADGDSLTLGAGDYTPASWSGGDYSDNIWGKVGLWKYDYTTPNAGWHPVIGANSYHQEWGMIRDVDVAIVGADTLYVIATSDGPKLLTKNGASAVWTEISHYTFNNAQEEPMTQPNWNDEAVTITKYTYAGPDGVDGTDDGHVTVVQNINSALPTTGTITINETEYTYTSYSGKTFDITGTLAATYAKGSTVTEPTDTQANWSNWINDAGDVYCVLTNANQSYDGDSGLYRLDYGTTTWLWCGDDLHTVASSEGFQSVAEGAGIDMTVADMGCGRWTSNPNYPAYTNSSYLAITLNDVYSSINGVNGATVDTLYMGGNFAKTILRGVITRGGTGPRDLAWDAIVTRDYTLDPAEAQPQPDLKRHGGWPNNWTMSLIHEMAIDPNDGKHIWMTPGDYSFWSTDGGESWTTNNNIGYNDTGGFIGTGQDETCTDGLAILSDGRMIVSHGDVYATISNDTTWTYQQRFTPLGLDNTEPCSTKNTVTPWNSESGAILSFQGWQGDTSDDDYILFMSGDVIQGGTAGKWYIIHDDNGDGDFFDVDEWENITTDTNLPNANTYTYLGNVVTNGTDKFWTPYTKYFTSLCDNKSEIEAQGVLEFYYDGASWIISSVDQAGFDAIGDCRPRNIGYDSVGNRLWVGAPFEGNGGGVYMIDLDDVNPTWLAVFGEGAVSPYDSWEIYGAVTSLEVSSDGTHIYWGGTGESGKKGGLWRITNGQAATNSFTIEWVLNNTGLIYIPEYTFSTIPDFYASRGGQWDSNEDIANRNINVSEILIDPANNDRIFFISGLSNSIDTMKGVYALDITNQEWVRLFEDDERSWLTSARTGDMLVYTDATNPARIAWGTHCIGISYMEYDGLFPTGNYGD